MVRLQITVMMDIDAEYVQILDKSPTAVEDAALAAVRRIASEVFHEDLGALCMDTGMIATLGEEEIYVMNKDMYEDTDEVNRPLVDADPAARHPWGKIKGKES